MADSETSQETPAVSASSEIDLLASDEVARLENEGGIASDDPEPLGDAAARRIGPTGLVYGGTPSSYQDLMNQKKAFDSKRRREESDRRFQATRDMPDYARMRSQSLQGKAYVILSFPAGDGNVLEWLVCDVSTVPNAAGIELMLIVPCPVCILKRQQPSEESMMQLRQSNRGFTLDQKGAGEMWVNPSDSREVYLQAGTVSTHEGFRCNNGCHTRYQIDKNVLRIA